MDSLKLQKYLSECGVMSRRSAEEEIKKGLVLINGQPANLGTRICPDTDIVSYKGKVIKPNTLSKTYILLNKPRGFVTTLSDEKGRPTVRDLIRDVKTRVYPVGRLDMDSDGLLILTNDGELTNRLTHPRHKIPKIYHVTVNGQPTQKQLLMLGSKMLLDGYEIQPVKVDVLSLGNNSSILQMTLFEGRNRQIRKMCELAELKITRLCRVAIGKIELGELECGKWRHLRHEEIEYLMKDTYKEDNKNA